jgi:hypothetical protein
MCVHATNQVVAFSYFFYPICFYNPTILWLCSVACIFISHVDEILSDRITLDYTIMVFRPILSHVLSVHTYVEQSNYYSYI